MHICAVQSDIVWEDKPSNFDRVRRLLEGRLKDAPRPALVVLPEMFATGFSLRAQALAEPPGGPTEQFLASCARDHGAWVTASFPAFGPDGHPCNQSILVDPSGTTRARYAKIQPFAFGGELANYKAGSRVCVTEMEGWKVALFICYDLRFPELFRLAVQQGAELFVVVASWPNRRTHHWVNLLQARAIENLAFVVGVNRAGSDPQHVYPGRSLIVNPHGEVLCDAGGEACVVQADLDVAVARSWRADFPALRDMRSEWWAPTARA